MPKQPKSVKVTAVNVNNMPDGSNVKNCTILLDSSVNMGENKRMTKVLRPIKPLNDFILDGMDGYIESKKQIDKYVIVSPSSDPRFRLPEKQHNIIRGIKDNLHG
jgi:hypothetical protein